ncbi:(pine wood nematode) hypothetical protein [Aphelenchoides besseyi]|nr:(pine wood nematode) hypothetical protein [Aphelenchoides besseyi]KAI6235664.1 (pine wood nematode) hypothetical protein [Aphelenchoides besseyi]
MCSWTFTVVAALTILFGLSKAAEEQNASDQGEVVDKRSSGDYYMPRASNWLSSRPLKAFSANDDISYILQYLEKRSDSSEGGRDIRSPLGTMRFGKRASTGPLGTMRFGKRGDSPLGTMRFGKRAERPLGTMRFGKRADSSVYDSDLF